MNIPNPENVYTIATKFNDEPNVIHLYRQIFDPKVVELKLGAKNPRTKEQTVVHFKGASTKRQKLYFYSEGNKSGELLGG